MSRTHQQLWFDVEKKKETTASPINEVAPPLWFDVEKKKETTLDQYRHY